MSDHQNGERAAWRGEDLFRTAFAHAAVGMAVTDADGRFLQANQAYCRITGYSHDELCRLDFASLTHPDDLPRNMDLIRRILDGTDPGFVLEKRYFRKHGEIVWVKASVSLVRDDGGGPLRIVALAEDITERKRSEDRLRSSEELTRLLLDSAGEPVYGIDTDGRCTFCNPACLRALGYDQPDDLLGRNMHELIHHSRPDGSPYPEHECRIYRAYLQGEGTHADDELLWRADGTPFPADYRSYPIRKDGAVVGSVVTFNDVTELKRAEATIAEQVRLAEYGRDVGRALTQGGTLEEVLTLCAGATVRHLDGAFARVWTTRDDEDVLELRASAGLYTHTDGPHARVPVGRYKIGLIAQERTPHLTNAVIGDPRIPAQEWARREGMVAFAGYPLVVEGRLVGVLAMFARHALSDAALRMMASVADEIAVGIERKRSEERLQRQREWLRVTLASIGDAVIATDTDGRITFLNGVAEALTGWPQHEAAGRDLTEVFRIVNEGTRQQVESPAIRALREGQIVGLANHTLLIARDGTELAIDDSAAPIRDEAGVVMGAVLIFRDVDERRRVERALAGSEARKAAILQMALDAIITIDDDGRILEWNPAAERVFGRGRAAVLGLEMAELIVPPSLRDAHRRGLARYLRSGEGPVLGRRIEITALRADGSEFPVELAITPITADGPPIFTAHLRDISGRREAERRRDTRLAVTETVAAASNLGEAALRILRSVCEVQGWDLGALWDVDKQAGVLRCVEVWHSGSAAVGEFGAVCRTRTMPIGVGLPGRVWRSDSPTWIPDVTADDNFPRGASAAGAGLHGAFACPIRGGDEVLGVIEFFSREVREPDPDLLEMMATLGGQVGQFIERRRAEEGLRTSERELADFFENATVGLHWVGPGGTILRANRAELDLLGYDADEYVGRHIAEFHADEEVIGDILRRLLAGESLHDFPARLRCKDGRIVDVLIDSSVMRRDGKFVHTRCFTRDVTERNRAQEALRAAKEEAEAANRAKTQFLAVLSHELRTPLNPILLAATSMLERPADPGEVRPTLEMIRQNVLLQSRLIDDLLDVMRIVRGKMPLHWEVADAHALIRQALEICQSEISGKGLRLGLDLGAEEYFLNADTARFQQVVWNLVKNAVKFTPDGGEITVRTRNPQGDGSREDRLAIEVTDTGIGIEPQILPLIFDPFQQGETRITRKFGGLGLGLAICRGIVEAHGGSLTAESPGRDRGTTFRIVLGTISSPAATDAEPAGTVATTVAPAMPSSLRILVVEDEPATLRLMARLLQGLGHVVKTANSVASGCEEIEGREFDLIVSDIGLPDGTGLELMRRVVDLRGPVPGIALTGYGMEEDIRRSREAGFTAHLTKPIDFAKLEAMIRQVAPAGV